MHVTFLLYEGIEPVDLAAVGVISMAKRVIPGLSYDTVASSLKPVRFSNGLQVLPTQTFDAVRAVDVLVVLGGPGWREASSDPAVLSFIQRVAPATTVCSVCTGAMVLAAAGVLDGMSATTKVEVVPPEPSPLAELCKSHPEVKAQRALLVDNGNVVTGGGVTLCIDAMLHLLEKRYGNVAVDEVARIMEYGAAREANRRRFALA